MIHNDHLGTPQKLTDSNGAVQWSADYKPFGETNNVTGSITNNLRFPGQYYDSETGLNYNYFRDYNPEIGRYIEADRVGIQMGKNHLYIYARSNPLSYSDSIGSIPNFGGGAQFFFGIFTAGGSVEFEECCKGKTKYQRTLGKIIYGLGIAIPGTYRIGGGGTGAVQITGPGRNCKDYSFWGDEEYMSCLSISSVIGVDICGSGEPDTLNVNLGMGAAVYRVRVRTTVIKEVAVGCCN